MRKFIPYLIALVVLLAAAAVLTVVIPRGPMNHGWDWPWHDWYHSHWAQRPASPALSNEDPHGAAVMGARREDEAATSAGPAATSNPNTGERSGPAAIQKKHGVTPHTPLLNTLLPDTKNLQVAVYETEYAPGGINPRHLHPAAMTVYVVSGTGVWQEEGKPPVTLHAGDSLFVPAGTIHSHWNPSTTEPLRFLEFIVSEKGKGRSIPLPTQN